MVLRETCLPEVLYVWNSNIKGLQFWVTRKKNMVENVDPLNKTENVFCM